MTESTDANCIFCQIIAGQVPCHKLYENEHVLSFLDIGPLSEGHCLIIPKTHQVTIDKLPDEYAAACGQLIPAISRAVLQATGASGWNVLQNNGKVAGQAVDHVHFHIIPRIPGDELGFRWPAGSLDDDSAERIAGAISQFLQ